MLGSGNGPYPQGVILLKERHLNPPSSWRVSTHRGPTCWSTPPGYLSRRATPSVCHQRHLGRVLRSSRHDPDEDLHRHAAENIAQADALLFGRMTYQMMEAGWRWPSGARPDWAAEWLSCVTPRMRKAKR